MRRMHEVREGQGNVCCFVDVKIRTFVRVNGKLNMNGIECATGLQIKNRIYLEDGRYQMVNSPHLKIVKKYAGIPEDASIQLAKRYEEYKKDEKK